MKKILPLLAFLCIACSTETTATVSSRDIHNPLENPEEGPAAGNSDGTVAVPVTLAPIDMNEPDIVIGDGTPESITAEAFIAAVAKGGKIGFNSGGEAVTITLAEPAKVFNDASDTVVIDGAGLITLSGGGTSRILYMNTCDPDQVWTTSHCQNQEFPQLFIQNITFADGNSTAEREYDGGGALWVRGGRLRMVNCRFFNNRCTTTGPDVGGGAVRVFSQYEDLPVEVVNCTFGGGEEYGNEGSNGGAISSIGVSWNIYNSLFTHNRALGNGGNPAQNGTPGGGSGGAIYNDGNTMTLALYGSRIENNEVNAFGGGIFFVSNDHSGSITIHNSTISNNPGGSWYPSYPGISMHDDTPVEVVESTIEE